MNLSLLHVPNKSVYCQVLQHAKKIQILSMLYKYFDVLNVFTELQIIPRRVQRSTLSYTFNA